MPEKYIPPPSFKDLRKAVIISVNIKGGIAVGEKEQRQNTDREEKLLQLIRELKFGEIHIYVADGQPVRAEEIKRSVKF